MNWIPDEHKNLYSRSLSALYTDLSKGVSNITTEGGKLVVAGYGKLKEGVNYISNHLDDTRNNITEDTDSSDNIDIIDTDSSYERDTDSYHRDDSYRDSSNDYHTDCKDDSYRENSHHASGRERVIIQLSKKDNRIKKIHILDCNDNVIPITGKISSHKHINSIIHTWFNYEKKENSEIWRWYPKIELYTSYRKSGDRLAPMEFIVFKEKDGIYHPYPYQ